jgi:signal transduction histidine kinase
MGRFMRLPTQPAQTEVDACASPSPHALLIVDDEPENLIALSALLEDTWKVHTAGSGSEALALLAAGVPVDLVIADQRMAGMTGIQLLTAVAEQYPKIMRVMLTAYADVEPMLDAVNRGSVFAFVVKPCEPEELRATVAEALRMKDRATLLQRLVAEYAERRTLLDGTLRELTATQEYVLAAERMTTVGRAVSGIVHNLRNLSGIMCILVDEIRARTSSQSLLSSAQASLESLHALARLLECVRQFSSVGEGAPALAPTEISGFLERTVALALMQTDDTRCPVELDASADISLLPVDADRMMQGLLALLDNALRASPPGSPVRVSVRPRHDSTSGRVLACIEVCDHGSGMDKKTLARATEPFYSGFVPKRLGLGLETARLAAQAHGGALELVSTPGGGTTASLLIPLQGGLPS